MNGKKFVLYFMVVTLLTSVGIGLWIKQAYDSRPNLEYKSSPTR